jgi:hypothetical protein
MTFWLEAKVAVGVFVCLSVSEANERVPERAAGVDVRAALGSRLVPSPSAQRWWLEGGAHPKNGCPS